MNKILFFLFLFCGCISYAQNRILFSYDTAGNQIVRQLCINCQTARKVSSPVDEEVIEKFAPEDQFSYYPNPVKEELFLSWKTNNGNHITAITVFSILGQQLKAFQASKNDNQTISFRDFPQGTYLVMLHYSNNEEQTIKIIKQ